MFARVSRYEIPSERIDDAIHGFRDALDEITTLAGFRDGYLLVNSADGCALTVTIWDDAATLEASRVTASRLRTAAARAADGAVTSAQDFEVAYSTSA
jgi:heme-degrading monooxygenase HmoA